MGNMDLFLGSATPSYRGVESQRSPILGVHFIHVYILCRRTTKFDVVWWHMSGRYVYLGVSHARLTFQENYGVPVLIDFWSSVFVPTYTR